MRIFSSDIKARYSLDVAPSGTQTDQFNCVCLKVICTACAHVRGRTKREDEIQTFQHLDCNSGACGCFLNAKGGCFDHLTKRSSSQWVTFKAQCLSWRHLCQCHHQWIRRHRMCSLFSHVSDMALVMAASVCQSLLSWLKYPDNCWMDCQEIYIHTFMTPRGWNPLTLVIPFLLCHHNVDICGFEWNISTAIG